MRILTLKTLPVLFALLLILCVTTRAGNEYTLGCRAYEENETQGAMVMKITRDLAEVMYEKYHIKLNVKWYNSEKEIKKAADDERLSFIFSSSGHYLELYGSGKFKPYMGVTIMGMKSKANCLYVRKKSSYKKINDLKNKKIITYGGISDYMELRKLTHGEPPEFFFDRLDIVNNGTSSFYALSMKEVDAAFVSQSTYQFMKKTNPGPVSNVRELACSFPWYDNPIFISKDVPDDDAEKIMSLFRNAYKVTKKNNKLKKYARMLKAYKIKFVPVSPEDFQPFYDLFHEGRKKGWDKDYMQWRKYVKDD